LKRVICALDYSSARDAVQFVDQAGDMLTWYKVGMELFTREGPPVVAALRERNKRVFLDLKYHDIPNTVRGAVKSAAALGVEMVTVHASGGRAMLEAAGEAAGGMLVAAVTLLTSLGEKDLKATGIGGSVGEMVEAQARLALSAGVMGVVCSPGEVARLKSAMSCSFTAITPGIRLEGDAKGDQKRISTPRSAIESGADYLVMGRSLTGVKNLEERLRVIARTLAGTDS